MIENDLNGKCLEEKTNSIKIDRYLEKISSISFAKVCFTRDLRKIFGFILETSFID
jgi:hypothetical protein